jgi:hypothetical protein
MLYVQNVPMAVSVFQRFSEFNLKEFLLAHNTELGFGFDKALIILLEAIKEIDSTISLYLVLHGMEQPSFVLSWLITYFTHDIKSSVLQYRIFDYLIGSHPLTVYFLTALITVDHVKVLQKEKNLDISDFFMHFQNIDLDNLDFDRYIIKTEEIMKKVDLTKFCKKIQNYKNYFYKSGYTVNFSLSE